MNTLLDSSETRPMQHRVSPLDSNNHTFANSQDSHGYDSEIHEPATRELTLGTATILGIFFALALICAVFFGFGYSLGSHHSVAAVNATASAAPIVPGTPKPSPGSMPYSSPGSYSAPPTRPSAPPSTETVTVPVTPIIARVTPTPAAQPTTTPAEPTPDPRPILTGAAQPIVQVAAVSHQEDAELIVSTLKRHGYPVVIRSEPQDKLLHLQLGPFPTKKEAEVMRQRLLADGFNAYIK